MRQVIAARLAHSTEPADPVGSVVRELGDELLHTWFRQPLRPAAVLIPLVDRVDGLTVLFTVRRHDMADHPGQIAFPGGRPDASDRDLRATAIREAHEEIALKPDLVEIVGNLAPQGVISGFAVVPFVGFVPADFEPVPEPAEVADVFEVPLDFLLDDRNARRVDRTRGGVGLPTWEYQWRDYLIWGATAQILRNFNNIIKY
jgi:8-oxo-dGTP pyrophosphatase MutT (NUDIX family)